MIFPSGQARWALVFVGAAFCLFSCGPAETPAASELQLVFPDAAPLAHRHRNHSFVQSADGTFYLYARQQGDDTHIVMVRPAQGGGWTEPVALDLPRREIASTPRLSADGWLYFTSDAQHPNRVGRNDLNIWRVTYDGETLGVPEVLPDEINTGADEESYAPLGAGRGVFASARMGGAGGYDLYFAEDTETGWQVTPYPHNSMMADATVAATPDGNTLFYYAHLPTEEVYGGVDLFMTQRQEGGWSAPTNLGPLINTQGIEYGPGVSGDGETLYFSRDGVLMSAPLKPSVAAAGFRPVNTGKTSAD